MFFKSVVTDAETPEYHGYNTRISREQGHSVGPATKAIYLPLLDMTPAEPDTMYTAMVEAQRLTNHTGQVYTIFTNDQQLYRVVVHVTWVYQHQFQNFIPRLGGMHTLMNFVGAVGVLMADTGLETILQVDFGGVASMLSGKKYPQNIRALRLLTEELLRGTIVHMNSHDSLMKVLDNKSQESRTTKLWVENLIKPVMLMMMFVRAEREADWPLHLFCVKEMLPYFFGDGHFNYARYCLYYLRSMEKLSGPVLQDFLQGKHVTRHQPGLWNAIWTDMFIESTFMRFGHSPGGIIGITLKPSTLKRWALSLHVCSHIVQDVSEMGNENHQVPVTVHKEEMPARKKTDAADREKLRETLITCIDPLNPDVSFIPTTC
ncbi:uncharacterized protein LOC135207056 [Macrobrachium nipponense]|uniref:uncharacterized protein LOC135207056 n=1 Tax=Macrobrachium nipponense TaxID=159736 RepID=UPI0030C83D23